MKPTRVYISGPISGHLETYEAAFALMADQLRAAGFIPVNPAEHNAATEARLGVGRHEAPHQEYMRDDLDVLRTCDGIVLLEGWAQSSGARVEAITAEALGLSFYDRDSLAEVACPEITIEAFDPKTPLATQASQLVNGARRKTYAHPSKNFGMTANIWSALLGPKLTSPITIAECGLMHIAAKMGREMMNHKTDNLRDIAGYAEATNKAIEEPNHA